MKLEKKTADIGEKLQNITNNAAYEQVCLCLIFHLLSKISNHLYLYLY